jgi:shikimate 5-dehydrogenase
VLFVAVAYDDLKAIDVIINSTSASLAGRIPPVPERLILSVLAVYDLMYGWLLPLSTPGPVKRRA